MTGEQFKTQEALVMVGQTVGGRYAVVEHLGTGGFAKVFKAFDKVIERDVAIKFLDLRGIAGGSSMIQTVLERFRREAKLAAKIPHRNVVNIFDIGQLDEEGFRPFIVMELLNGFDLEDQLTEHGPMRARRLVPLFVDCLDALGQAHELGIVHKDLKPSNLFLSDPGERAESLRIVDFGIAHIKGTGDDEADAAQSGSSGHAKRLTATGQILGTLQYLAPEYIATQTVSPALDVYQMALILIELLSGERVIDTDNAFECLRIHTFGLLEIPEYLLDSDLGDVLHRALESDHMVRYQNAREFADALSKVDVSAIPDSPKFGGDAPLTTHALNSSISSPSIKTAPNTAEVRRPGTNEMKLQPAQKMTPTSELEVGAPPGSPGTQHVESEFKSQRTEVSREKTESTSLAGSLDASLVDDVEETYAPPRQNLHIVLGGVLLLILLAGGALAAIVQSRPGAESDSPSTTRADTPSEASVVAAPTPRVEVPVSPPEGTQDNVPELDAPLKDVETNPLDTPPAVASTEKTPEKTPQKNDSQARKKSPAALPTIVTLDISPKSATVHMGSKKLAAPYVVEIPADAQSSPPITVSKSGYETTSFRVTSKDSTYRVSLEKKRQPVREEKTTDSASKPSKPKVESPPPARDPAPKVKKGMQLMD